MQSCPTKKKNLSFGSRITNLPQINMHSKLIDNHYRLRIRPYDYTSFEFALNKVQCKYAIKPFRCFFLYRASVASYKFANSKIFHATFVNWLLIKHIHAGAHIHTHISLYRNINSKPHRNKKKCNALGFIMLFVLLYMSTSPHETHILKPRKWLANFTLIFSSIYPIWPAKLGVFLGCCFERFEIRVS